MDEVISLKGIDETIANLFRSRKAVLRFKMAKSVRECYREDEDLKLIKKIPAESLIKKIWDTGDAPKKIKEKRKNFSSLKSSLNQSFKKLAEEGKNPEGIKIGRENTFVISDEKKNELIKELSATVKENESLQNMIAAFRQTLGEINPDIGSGDYQAALEELEKTKKMIQELSGRKEVGGLKESSPGIYGGGGEGGEQRTVRN